MADPTPAWFEALFAWSKEHGRWDFVQALLLGPKYVSGDWENWICNHAAEPGYLDLLQWFESQKNHYGFVFNIWPAVGAAAGGHVHILQWMRTCTPPWPWNGTTFANAAHRGHWGVLRWLQTQGCPLHKRVCAAAAAGGHLEILQWLRQQNCPWDGEVYVVAAKNGHLKVMQWAREYGCPWDAAAYSEAVRGGYLPIVQWLRQQGCPWPEWSNLFDHAVFHEHYPLLLWLMDTGESGPTRPENLHWSRKLEYYWARQGLRLRHGIQWSNPAIQRWLKAVEDAAAVLERLLCPDLVRLIQQYS